MNQLQKEWISWSIYVIKERELEGRTRQGFITLVEDLLILLLKMDIDYEINYKLTDVYDISTVIESITNFYNILTISDKDTGSEQALADLTLKTYSIESNYRTYFFNDKNKY